MAMSRTCLLQAVGKAALDLIKQNPQLPSRTLARLLVRERADIFQSVDQARSVVRKLRGASGDKERRMRVDYGVSRVLRLPVSDMKAWTPYIVPDSVKRTLVLPDGHVPEHDNEAIQIAVQKGKERKVDSVIFSEWLDFHQLSRFTKDPRKRSVSLEISAFHQVLDYVEDELNDPLMIYKEGNHDEHLDRYVMTNSVPLFGMDGLNLASQLQVKERGLVLVSDKRPVKYGKLNIVHGHEWGGGVATPVNPARGLYLRAKKSSLCFHHHRSSSHSGKDIDGEIVTCWSAGCLCGLNPAWKPLNEWNHGFCILEKEMSGNFRVENYKIIRGEVFPE